MLRAWAAMVSRLPDGVYAREIARIVSVTPQNTVIHRNTQLLVPPASFLKDDRSPRQLWMSGRSRLLKFDMAAAKSQQSLPDSIKRYVTIMQNILSLESGGTMRVCW
jgi:hypothetical protein